METAVKREERWKEKQKWRTGPDVSLTLDFWAKEESNNKATKKATKAERRSSQLETTKFLLFFIISTVSV